MCRGEGRENACPFVPLSPPPQPNLPLRHYRNYGNVAGVISLTSARSQVDAPEPKIKIKLGQFVSLKKV